MYAIHVKLATIISNNSSIILYIYPDIRSFPQHHHHHLHQYFSSLADEKQSLCVTIQNSLQMVETHLPFAHCVQGYLWWHISFGIVATLSRIKSGFSLGADT